MGRSGVREFWTLILVGLALVTIPTAQAVGLITLHRMAWAVAVTRQRVLS